MKIAFIDVETTGRKSEQNSIWALSLILVIDEKVAERKTWYMRPMTTWEEPALELAKQSFTEEEIRNFPMQYEAFEEFTKIITKYVDKFDKKDKLLFGGYNSKFDEEYVRAWFDFNDDKYYGSWFFSGTLDIMALCVFTFRSFRHKFPNFQLATLAAFFGIELEAHKSESDVNATFEIYKELTKRITIDLE